MVQRKSFLCCVLIIVVAVISTGCVTGIEYGGATQATAGSGQITQKTAPGKGRGYFMRECIKCHRIFYPEERKSSEWAGILARKKSKVSLSMEQYAQLSEYVMEASRKAENAP